MTTQDLQIKVAGGVILNAAIDGPENAPWIVFANSVLTDLSVWDAQAAALRDRYRVLRFDQRGHGKSTVPDRPMDFARYGADLVALMQAVGAKDACFVGLSMGVPTGLAAFAANPQLFSRLVFVDGISKSGPGREEFWRERREFAQCEGMQVLAEKTATGWMPGEDAKSRAPISLKDMIAATPVEGFAAASHALGGYDQSAVLAAINCPVLCVAGELDGAMPDTMRAQFGAIPGVRFATIKGAGHIPNFQKPAQFNATLTTFLEETA